jgi:heterogeneous nuclear ribonucleoprotein U-like protein 1
MVGLPGVGKTTWVRRYLKDNSDERWTLLSADTILAAMKVFGGGVIYVMVVKVNGVARRRVHQGRWDMVMGLAAKALMRSLHFACRRRRNYIIDQTNVNRDTRRRKMTPFRDFQRKAVVIIPSDDDFLARQLKQARADGSATMPAEAMLEMKGELFLLTDNYCCL